jgi:hypothetical protein
MKHLYLCIVFSIAIIGLTGCTQQDSSSVADKDRFVGTWISYEDERGVQLSNVFVFSDDGSCNVFKNGTYTLSDDVVSIVFDDNETQSFSYVFSDDDNLILTDSVSGYSYVCIREGV